MEESRTKTYAVTGVASGIGQETAKLLTSRGHRVIGLDIVEPTRRFEPFVRLDLDSPKSIRRAAERISEPLDGLCNSAGLAPRPRLEAKILHVNFLGQRLLTNALLARMNPGAAIVNLASWLGSSWKASLSQILTLSKIAGRAALNDFVAAEVADPIRAYILSKQALIAWSMSEAKEMNDRKIRMNTLSPGSVATRIGEDLALALRDHEERNEMLAGRAGTPQEIAAIATFLLSSESEWIKGSDIPADGGNGALALCDALELAPMSSAPEQRS